MSKRERYSVILGKYLPHEFIHYVIDLLVQYPVKFRISKPRKTKLGDYRFNPSGIPEITVNGDLNKYSFLITTLHEFAHLIAFEEHGRRIKPHGREWQITYARLIKPVIDSGHLPDVLSFALTESLVNIKASSCTDKRLHRVLSDLDSSDEHILYLEDIGKDTLFSLNGKIFSKGNLRRTRFVCMERSSQKMYLISALARVKEIKEDEE